MKYCFDKIIPRQGFCSYKHGSFQADMDVLPLWGAGMDSRMASAITEALARRIERGIFGYKHVPDGNRCELVFHGHACISFASICWEHLRNSVTWVSPGRSFEIAACNHGEEWLTQLPACLKANYGSLPGTDSKDLSMS